MQRVQEVTSRVGGRVDVLSIVGGEARRQVVSVGLGVGLKWAEHKRRGANRGRLESDSRRLG